ncbi:Zn-dependent protease (includes SpoIVFB) [Fontimonas thermophila]|uniref:Zn-dependent protease (Includes SpoIVFB) n=1 Tax=Fontimonas thermophila TaxID=1076937 RepID=A0A1I2I096_9GAMM|nr:site-2 protease family protein [Fontimonas thermophila]SFF34276.1 Zn-dependent protease (includes SpoIVFB) [Fontimonas thermophila]
MPIDMTLVQKLAVWALPVLLAITVHEASHGYVARALGDPTAEALGRLSLNPLRHIDPVGTILVPAVLLALGGFLFGWAKPVPVNMRNLGHPRRDMALVAAAGPLSNCAMALGWGLLLKFALAGGDEGVWLGLRYMAIAGIVINLVLMVLNLLPLPPLDGGRVLTGLVPEHVARQFDRIEPYGLLILVILLATGLLGRVLYWPLTLAEAALFAILGLPPATAL